MIKNLTYALLLFPLVCLAKSKDTAFLELTREQRRIEALETKAHVATNNVNVQVSTQHTNGDEALYSDFRGSFGVTLQHDSNGFIIPNSFKQLVKALQSQKPSDFNKIPIGAGFTKLTDPQAGFAFSLESNDPWLHTVPAAPAFASAERGADTVEVYCSALNRDVLFENYDSSPTVAQSVADLNLLSNFTGPKINGVVTPDTFLRGTVPGCLEGPYISQFLLNAAPFGTTQSIGPALKAPPAGSDFLKTFANWYQVTNGGAPLETAPVLSTVSYIRDLRDLTELVHKDTPGQTGLIAVYILNTFGNAALDPANPYYNNPTQAGFVTFALPRHCGQSSDVC